MGEANLKKVVSTVFLVLLLTSVLFSIVSVKSARASTPALPKIIILGQQPNEPQTNTLLMNINQSFTMTVNMTDYPNLYIYQIVLKYNQSILNMTTLTFPSNNVFGSLPSDSVFMTPFNQTPSSLIDTQDGLGVAIAGQSLLSVNSVDVSNGILFQANFTAEEAGQTTIQVATANQSAHLPNYTAPWFTFTQEGPVLPLETTDFDLSNATLLVIAQVTSVPEFPEPLIIILSLLATLLIAVIYKKKRNYTKTNSLAI